MDDRVKTTISPGGDNLLQSNRGSMEIEGHSYHEPGSEENGAKSAFNRKDMSLLDVKLDPEGKSTSDEVYGNANESNHMEDTSISSSHNESTDNLSTTSAIPHPPPPPDKDRPDSSSTSTQRLANVVPPISNGAQSQRPYRSQTISSVSTNGLHSSAQLSSIVFVLSSLELIAASKEARKKKALGDAVQKALTAVKQLEEPLDPEVIFEPLRLATETGNAALITTALDCIGKLISYSYFSLPSEAQTLSSAPEQDLKPPLIDQAIETICDCFQDETTPAEIQLQIIKSLLAAVLNDKFVVHGSGLLKAVRQVYNIFLLSKSNANQQVAQGTLSQMVGTVFERVSLRLGMKEARINMSKLPSERDTASGSQIDINHDGALLESSDGDGATEANEKSESSLTLMVDQPMRNESGEKLTLQSFENAKSFDDAKIGDNAPTMITRTKSTPNPLRSVSELQNSVSNGNDNFGERGGPDEDEEDEIFVKDAYLVFRSMCRLSIKQLDLIQQQDVKSSSMRSKLVSLAIIRTLLNNHMIVFNSPLVTIRSSTNNEPTSFGQATNQYLRLSLSKNGASPVRQVFECCAEIFWLMLKDMRVMLKVFKSNTLF
jgi:brefeldin A-inhibited guanine nucleotide-exchange protein